MWAATIITSFRGRYSRGDKRPTYGVTIVTGAKILIGVGMLLVVLCAIVVGVSLILPVLTDGRASWEEAMLGAVPGGLCCALSILILLGGVVWLVLGRKK